LNYYFYLAGLELFDARDIAITAFTSLNDVVQQAPVINVFPSPASTALHVEVPESAGSIIDAKVIDISGRTVRSSHPANSKFTIDTESMPQGVFVLLVNTEKGTFVRKFVVAHNQAR
jgi:hypothetical protein